MRKLALAVSVVAMLAFAVGTTFAADATNLAQTVSTGGAPGLVTPMPTLLKDAIVASNGTAVQNFVVTQGELVNWSGIYVGPNGPGDMNDGVADGWVTVNTGGPTEDATRIAIWCDIELYSDISIKNYNVYFHRSGATAGQQDAYVQGKVAGNHNSWIGLSTANCDPEKLQWRSDALGRTLDPLTQPITVVYGFADTVLNPSLPGVGIWAANAASLSYRPYDSKGAGQTPAITAIWWRVNGGLAPYVQEYQWKVSINPPANQQDGHYELDPLVVVMPAL